MLVSLLISQLLISIFELLNFVIQHPEISSMKLMKLEHRITNTINGCHEMKHDNSQGNFIENSIQNY